MVNKYSKLERHYAEGRAREELRHRATYGNDVFGDLPTFYRFVVVETIFDPTLVDDDKAAYFENIVGVSNMRFARVLPRNSIVARRVLDSTTIAEFPAMFLFPFFPSSIALPCKPGEHVWVYIDRTMKADLGYWFCRITEPGFVDDVNHTHAPRVNDPSMIKGLTSTFDGHEPVYEFRNGVVNISSSGERTTAADTNSILGSHDEYEKIINGSDGGKLSYLEPVPRFKKRPGDIAFEGSNNTLLVLGRDRTGSAAKYKTDDNVDVRVVHKEPDDDATGTGVGAIDIVAGRGQTPDTLGNVVETTYVAGGGSGSKEIAKTADKLVEREGDPDFANDRSRIYVAQRTKVDKNFKIDQFNIEFPDAQTAPGSALKDSDKGDGGIVIKSDKVRIIARSDIEIVVTGNEKDADGNMMSVDDTKKWAAIVIRSNGDIIFRPSEQGYIKLGGDKADKGIVCTDSPVTLANGGVAGPPLQAQSAMGPVPYAGAVPAGQDNAAPVAGAGKYANKVLIL